MGPARILFVDDDVLNHWVMAADLAEAGYTVCGQCRGDKALRFLEEGCDFDLLLTDVQLPGGMSGLDLAASWRRLHPGRPVLFISSVPQGGMDEIGSEAGFIMKHAQTGALIEMVDRLLTVAGSLPPPSGLSAPVLKVH